MTTYIMNQPGSNQVIDTPSGLQIGDVLRFNYSNEDQLSWNVPTQLNYKILAYGAKGEDTLLGEGGLGGKAGGVIKLNQGDVLSFQVWKAGYGGAGSLVFRNSELIIAGGGGTGGINYLHPSVNSTNESAINNGDGYIEIQLLPLDITVKEATSNSFVFSIHLMAYNHTFRWRTFINNQPLNDWSENSYTGLDYWTSWDSSRFSILNQNTFRIEIEYESSFTQAYEYTFAGQYKNLIFLGPDSVLYSDDLGNTLNKLSLGDPRVGTTTDSFPIILKNTLNIPLRDITLYVSPSETDRESKHLISIDNQEFKERVYYQPVLKTEETLTFYVKAKVGEHDNKKRQFRIHVYGIEE